MQLITYAYRACDGFLDYEFTSEGPRGIITKAVHFTEIKKNIYNIGFGDLTADPVGISDTIITNNNDSLKVFATVASIIQYFTELFPEATIIARGNTPARTRLYRIGITNYMNRIRRFFTVYGLKDNEWQIFETRKEYEAFLVRRK